VTNMYNQLSWYWCTCIWA